MMKPNDPGAGCLIGEMAANRIADIFAQLLRGVALSEDGGSHGVRGEPAIGVLFDNECDLAAHGENSTLVQ